MEGEERQRMTRETFDYDESMMNLEEIKWRKANEQSTAREVPHKRKALSDERDSLTKACDRNYEAVWQAKNDKRKKAIDKAERQARLIMALLMVNLAMLGMAAIEGIALIWAMWG